MTRINARASHRELNTLGHSVHGRLMYADKSRVCHGVTAGMIKDDWRARSNARCVVVKHTTVDTISCL